MSKKAVEGKQVSVLINKKCIKNLPQVKIGPQSLATLKLAEDAKNLRVKKF